MPALAVTEHGNMFSSVVFHDHARERGLKPILGCEVYVAQGSRFDKSGPQTETNHLVLLAETDEGYKNLIKLVSAGYTEGFYYRPRIDKELLAQHATGLIGLSSCLKGEVASALKVEQARPALEAAARLRDILGKDNFFLEMQYQGIEEQKSRQSRHRPAGPRSRAAARRDQRRALPEAGRLPAARHPPLHRHREDGQRRAAPSLHRRSVLSQDARADGRRLQGLPRGAAQHDARRRALQRHDPEGTEPPALLWRAEGFTLDEYLRARGREGFAQRLARLQQLAAPDAFGSRSMSTFVGSTTRSR